MRGRTGLRITCARWESGADVLVGLCVERSLELVVGLLGIWKAGGVYVPLDPGYPAQRLAYLLEDTGAAVLLTSAGLLARLPRRRRRGCVWTANGRRWRGSRRATRPPTARPDDLAYVIYTSGSTGTPEGRDDRAWLARQPRRGDAAPLFSGPRRLRAAGVADRIRSVDLADDGPARVGRRAWRCSSPTRIARPKT